MKVLLDTHAFLWWIMDNPRLSARASNIIAAPETIVYVSAATAWEISVKSQIGKLSLTQPVKQYIPTQMTTNGFLDLPITVDHALHIHSLPLHHRDPFDRMLVAQSQLEEMPILSADPLLSRYTVDVIW